MLYFSPVKQSQIITTDIQLKKAKSEMRITWCFFFFIFLQRCFRHGSTMATSWPIEATDKQDKQETTWGVSVARRRKAQRLIL